MKLAATLRFRGNDFADSGKLPVNDADIGELERAAYAYAMAGFDCPKRPAFIPWPLQASRDYWPLQSPGKAYVYEKIRRVYGPVGIEYAKTLPLMRSH
jgi:hypothetical protein